MRVRPAQTADAAAVAAIYGYYVRETCVTFVCEEPSAAHYAEQIAEGQYPFFVAEEEGTVAGFAYASAFRPHDAYRWDVEATIYLAPGREGHGTGSLLMEALLDSLAGLGYLNVYSCLTVPNARSEALHRRFGFTSLGVFPGAGYKHGQWHDVHWLLKTLAPLPEHPEEPRRFAGAGADGTQAN